MQKLSKEFTQDFRVMELLTFEPRLCTLQELKTVYTTKDFYDFLEIMEAHKALEEDAREASKAKDQAKSR